MDIAYIALISGFGALLFALAAALRKLEQRRER